MGSSLNAVYVLVRKCGCVQRWPLNDRFLFQWLLSGTQLMEDLRKQAERFGADIRNGIATSADLSKRPYRIAPVRLRAWTLRDSGRVPLTPQKNAKGGELRTQLAALRQVSAALQRILLRAKRKPAPGIRRSRPGASPTLGTGGGDAGAALAVNM